MNPGIVLVSHPGIAEALLTQARRILGEPLAGIRVVEIESGGHADRDRLRDVLASADEGAGVLVMTDLPGATPANLAVNECGEVCIVISGLNLPMLIRACNYRSRALADLAALALEGGRRSLAELG